MFRLEGDSIGEREIPIKAYYGVQSLRASENFRISGRLSHNELVLSAVAIKKGSAIANFKAGAIDKKVCA
jgi:aspartate ammonia-lyase